MTEKTIIPEIPSNLPVLSTEQKIVGMPMLREPDIIIAEAQKVAKAIKKVIDSKPKKVVINGKRFLEFDDWQMIGAPYGITALIKSTSELYETTKGKKKFIGFLAKAAAIKDNVEISTAEAECLLYEKNWSNKAYNQRFMIRSMAQTRAASKALSNVLRWVVVLAGYQGTPAEEMNSDESQLPKPIFRSIMRIIEKKRINIKEVKRFVFETYGAKKISQLEREEGEELLGMLNSGKIGGDKKK